MQVIFEILNTIFGLIIEYWVIQPLKYQQNEPAKPIYYKYISLFTVLMSFVIFCFFIVDGLNLSLTFPPLINTNRFFVSFMSDSSISLAASIYMCVVLNVTIGQNKQNRIFSIFVLPPVLLLLWASVFLSKNLFAFFVCLLSSNYWMVGGLLWAVAEFSIENIRSVSILSLFLFPTNALILIFLIKFPPFWAWIIAFVVFATQVYIIIKVAE